MLTWSNLSLMEFIEAKVNPNSTLKMLSKKVEERSPKLKEKRVLKSPKIANRTNPAAAHLARSCHPAWPGRATLLADRAGWFLGARSCARLSACVFACFARVLPRFPPFCFSWCFRLPPSSNLPWTYFWSPLFHRNPMISPEMNLGTIWIEGR